MKPSCSNTDGQIYPNSFAIHRHLGPPFCMEAIIQKKRIKWDGFSLFAGILFAWRRQKPFLGRVTTALPEVTHDCHRRERIVERV